MQPGAEGARHVWLAAQHDWRDVRFNLAGGANHPNEAGNEGKRKRKHTHTNNSGNCTETKLAFQALRVPANAVTRKVRRA